MNSNFGMANLSSGSSFDYLYWINAAKEGQYLQPIYGHHSGKEYWAPVTVDKHWRTDYRGWLTIKARRRKR